MKYNLFWAKYINKAEETELGLKIIITSKIAKSTGIRATVVTTMAKSLENHCIEKKCIPYSPQIETSLEYDASERWHELCCVIKVMANKGWRNWFPMPLLMRREQFRAVDRLLEILPAKLFEASKPLIS